MNYDDIRFQDVDPAIGLLEVRQAYALEDDALEREAKLVTEKWGTEYTKMNLSNLCVLRESARRRLESTFDPEQADAQRALFEELSDVLYERTPPIS